MGDVNARNSLFYCFLETPLFLSLYGAAAIPIVMSPSFLSPLLSSALPQTQIAQLLCCELFALKSVLFRPSPTVSRTHAQFIKSLGEVRIVVRLGSVKLRDLVGYFHFLRSLITAIQCLKPLLALRLMTKIPNGGTNREEGR